MKNLISVLVLFLVVGVSYAAEVKLTPSDGAAEDRFGISVSISGDYAVVGTLEDADRNYSGSAYVFVRSGNNWTQQSKLTPSDGAENDRFGTSVSISGDYAVIGALGDADNGNHSGSVYIYLYP